MDIWTFRIFIDADGNCEFEEWYQSRSQKDQARLDRLFNALRALDEWKFPLISHRGGYQHFELRTKGTVPLRPLGFRTGEKEFTLLFGAIEESSKLVPKTADEKADQNRKLVVQDKERYTKIYE